MVCLAVRFTRDTQRVFRMLIPYVYLLETPTNHGDRRKIMLVGSGFLIGCSGHSMNSTPVSRYIIKMQMTMGGTRQYPILNNKYFIFSTECLILNA